MQFAINKETILPSLHTITGLVDKRQTLPIIGNLLLEIRNNQLFMTATNLEVELQVKSMLAVDSQDKRMTVPAKKFHDIVAKVQDDSIIECTLSDNQIKIHTPSVDFELATISADDFPLMKEKAIQLPDLNLTLSQQELLRIIEKTSYAMAIQDVRYFLNGMLFDIHTDSLHVVATDGHRLATARTALSQQAEPRKIIVPRKGVFELMRIINDADSNVELSIQANIIKAKTKNVEYKCKLIEGEYPNYVAVIPSEPESTFVVNTQNLLGALERTAIVLHEKPKGTRLLLEEGKLTMQTVNALGERAKEDLQVEYQGSAVQLGYNTEYLLDAVGKIKTEQTRVSFNDPNESCLIEEQQGDESRFVIMSMKI